MTINHLALTGTLTGIRFKPLTTPGMSLADFGTIASIIAPFGEHAQFVTGGGITAILTATGTTATASPSVALTFSIGNAAALKPGMVALSANLAPGTFVGTVVGSTVTLSQNPIVAGATTFRFVPPSHTRAMGYDGVLVLPGGRGRILLQQGDLVFVDSGGWPIVIAGQAIGFTGSQWTVT